LSASFWRQSSDLAAIDYGHLSLTGSAYVAREILGPRIGAALDDSGK